METVNKNQQVIELDYPAVRVSKSLVIRLLDFFLCIVLGLILNIATLFIIQESPLYKDISARQRDYMISSHLYHEAKDENEDTMILNAYRFYLQDDKLTNDEKSFHMEESLTFFFGTYVNEELSNEGMKYYLEAKSQQKTEDGKELFDKDGQRILVSDDYDLVYFNAYGNILEDYALGYLNVKGDYLDLRKQMSLFYLIGIPLTFVVSYTILYYIVPLCFSRGKRTIGMLTTKTALLSADGMSVKAGRFTCYFLFKLFIVFLGSFAALLIPLGVSLTMVFLSKSHQSLSEYVCNVYLVSIESQTVYKDVSEFYLANKHDNSFPDASSTFKQN